MSTELDMMADTASTDVLVLDGESLRIVDTIEVARDRRPVSLDRARVAVVADTCERLAEWGRTGQPVYGVNTGFGELAHVFVGPEHGSKLQLQMLRSHTAGSAPHFPAEAVRAMMLARLNCLIKGYSGVSADTVELLAACLNRGVHPVVPQQGSLGASGDLIQLAHIALVLAGEGTAEFAGEVLPGGEALARAGLEPITLGYKEGLALINGTSAMTGLASITVQRVRELLRVAVLLSATYVESLEGSTAAYKPRGHELRNHDGQQVVAALMNDLLEGSRLARDHEAIIADIARHTTGGPAVTEAGTFIQNAYTLRCVPQILGPVLETLRFVEGVVERELNSCNDNPLIFEQPAESFHGGNFHGQYVAMACDHLAVAVTQIGVLADRQLDRVLHPAFNGSLPEFLALESTGLHCGFTGAQFLATSIAAENLTLAHPASVQSLPSNGQNQDVVSMGLTSARRCAQLADNVETILVVLAGALAQAIAITGAERFAAASRDWHDLLRDKVEPYRDDYPMHSYLESVRTTLRSDKVGELLDRWVPLST